MCKLSFIKTKDGTAYKKALAMIKHQEDVVAGHSTGFCWHDNQGVHVRKSIGKIINFLTKYPDVPKTDICLGHSRYASVGIINIQNQHPIPIIVNKKRIGYLIHNGTWGDYYKYEYMKNPNLSAKTDSGLMATIYGKILTKYGNNKINRIKALGTLNRIINSYEANEFQNNFILLFDDKHVVFGGWELTYQFNKNKVGIMTFGLKNSCEKEKIYDIQQGFSMNRYGFSYFQDFKPKPKEIEKTTMNIGSSNPFKTNKIKKIDNKKWILVGNNFKTYKSAKLYGAMIKARYNVNYRVVENKNGRWSLYEEYVPYLNDKVLN